MTPEDAKKDVLPGLLTALQKELGIPSDLKTEIKPSLRPGKYDVTITVRNDQFNLEIANWAMELHHKVRYGNGKIDHISTLFL